MTDRCEHDWNLDSEIVPPLDAPILCRSIFLECLKCNVIYRDEQIVDIIRNYEKVIHGFRLIVDD